MIETLPQSEAATTETTPIEGPRYLLTIPADDWAEQRNAAQDNATPWPTAEFVAKWEHAARVAGWELDPTRRPLMTFEIDRFSNDLRIDGPVRSATTQAAGDPLTPEERQSLTIWGETIGAQSRVYADVDDDLKVTGRYRVLVLHVKDDAPRSAENGNPVELPAGDVAKLRALIEAADARPLV